VFWHGLRDTGSGGAGIGRTAMHQGDIGFQFTDRCALHLAPAYDMLPMSLVPSRLGVVGRHEPLAAVARRGASELEHLCWAAPVAAEFWRRAAGDARVRSAALRELAAANAARLAEMALRYAGRGPDWRLPVAT